MFVSRHSDNAAARRGIREGRKHVLSEPLSHRGHGDGSTPNCRPVDLTDGARPALDRLMLTNEQHEELWMKQLGANNRLGNRYDQGLNAMERRPSSGNRYFHSEMSTSTLAHFLPGAAVAGGRYQVMEQVGMGSLSVVFKALDTWTGLIAALKVAQSEHYPAQLAREMLMHELRAYRTVQGHPNILFVYDLLDVETTSGLLPVLVTEYAPTTLREWLFANRFDQNRRISYGKTLLRQVLAAVKHLESRDVIHRDIKPENLLLAEDGTIRLADFGLAYCRNWARSDAMTRVWASSPGTPQYMAPEAFLARTPNEVDHRIDLYAIGCVGYELHSEQCTPPFMGSYEELRHQHLHCAAPKLREPVPEQVAVAIAKCLEKTL